MNPYQPLLYEHLAALGYPLERKAEFCLRWLVRSRREVRILHFHWRIERCYHSDRGGIPCCATGLAALLHAVRFVLILLAARAFGYRIIWTVHELYRQTAVSKFIERAVGAALARVAHVVFVHDGHAAERVRAELAVPRARIRVSPHPSFLGVYPAGEGRLVFRGRLGLRDEQVAMLCFGSLRTDKRLDLLLDAFGSVPDPALVLIVAGGVRDAECARLCKAAAGRDHRIRLSLDQVPHGSVADLFAAADVFVSPRADDWTSGSLILALSLGLPAIVADCASNRELIGLHAAGWTFHPGDSCSLARAIACATADRQQLKLKAAAALHRAEELPCWSELALETARAIGVLPEQPAGCFAHVRGATQLTHRHLEVAWDVRHPDHRDGS